MYFISFSWVVFFILSLNHWSY